jgi:hypothetical protein
VRWNFTAPEDTLKIYDLAMAIILFQVLPEDLLILTIS